MNYSVAIDYEGLLSKKGRHKIYRKPRVGEEEACRESSVSSCGLRVGNERIILAVVSDGPLPGSMVVN